MFYSNAHKGTHTSIHSQEFHLSKTLLHLLISYRFASIQTAGVFSTSSETRRSAIKIYTTILHEPTGYKEGVGGEFEENVKVNRWKRKAEECSFACHLSALCCSPIPASPCLGGLNNCSWWGGKCSLCSFSVPLGVLPTLTTLAISCRLTLSEFHKHRNTNTHTNTQALCNIWTLFTLCSLSHLPMWGSL